MKEEPADLEVVGHNGMVRLTVVLGFVPKDGRVELDLDTSVARAIARSIFQHADHQDAKAAIIGRVTVREAKIGDGEPPFIKPPDDQETDR